MSSVYPNANGNWEDDLNDDLTFPDVEFMQSADSREGALLPDDQMMELKENAASGKFTKSDKHELIDFIYGDSASGRTSSRNKLMEDDDDEEEFDETCGLNPNGHINVSKTHVKSPPKNVKKKVSCNYLLKVT